MSLGKNPAISTSWNAYRFNNGAQLLLEINQLGFGAIELSFNLTSGMVDEIAELAPKLKISINSLHNYCPIPDGFSRKQALPDCYSLASLDKKERCLAVEYTKRSIDTASRLGARVLVLHCGRVEMSDYTRALINLYNQGASDKAIFIELKEEMIRERSLKAPVFLAQVLNSLDELNIYAKIKNVLLGIETRFYHREIPDISEIGVILQKFKNSQIHYWHDTGHAQVIENLGFAKHIDFLKLYGSRLIGVHLHDVLGCQDHLAPSAVNLEPCRGIDFAMLKPYLKQDSLKVIEAHHPATAEDLIESRNFISEIYDGSN
jgi:sugar phosphate isomerase/epimerase